MVRSPRLVAILVPLLLASSAASASATTYYVAPGASNNEAQCTTPTSSKCSLSSALNLAGSFDTVSLAPGTYSTAVAKTHTDSAVVGPGPGSAQATILLPSGSLELTQGSSIADVAVTASGTEALKFDNNTTATRTFVRSGGATGCRIAELPVTIIDSVCATTQDAGTIGGITMNAPGGSGPLTLIGVTAAAPQAGVAVTNAPGRQIEATNTLMVSSNGACPLLVLESNNQPRVTVISSHSAYEQITSASKCVGAGDGDPAHVYVADRRDGDYIGDVTLVGYSPSSPGYLRLPAGSPAIDRGMDDNGSTDADAVGLPRALGGHPDIGALEYYAPPTVSGIALSRASAQGVAIGADVDGHGLGTATTVFYGRASTSERQSNPVVLSRATSAGHVEVAIDLLTPQTTYTYMLCTALFDGAATGRACGPEKTFTTTALPPQISGSAVDGITSTGATVRATVNPESDATQVHVEYGPTTAYGSSTPTVALTAGGEDQDVVSTLTGLTPGTTSHARVVATNSGGTTQGEDLTIITAAATGPAPTSPTGGSTTTTTTGATPPPVPTTVPPPATPPPPATITLGAPTVAKTGTITLTATVSGPGTVVALASAQPPATARQRKAHRTPARVAYTKLTAAAPAAGPVTLKLRPTRAVLGALRKRRLPVTVLVGLAPQSGAPAVSASVKTTAPKLRRAAR